MGLRELEAAILRELRDVERRRSIRQKDIMEWQTGQDSVKVVEGEKYTYLPALGISVAWKDKPNDT